MSVEDALIQKWVLADFAKVPFIQGFNFLNTFILKSAISVIIDILLRSNKSCDLSPAFIIFGIFFKAVSLYQLDVLIFFNISIFVDFDHLQNESILSLNPYKKWIKETTKELKRRNALKIIVKTKCIFEICGKRLRFSLPLLFQDRLILSVWARRSPI